jgi:hypothetical protein
MAGKVYRRIQQARKNASLVIVLAHDLCERLDWQKGDVLEEQVMQDRVYLKRIK